MHLHAAAARGDQAGIRYALGHHTAVDARDSVGSTALHRALEAIGRTQPAGVPKADQATIELLLASGADIHAKDELGTLPVHLAAASLDVDILKLLAAHGGNLRQISRAHYSAFISVAYKSAGPAKLRMIEYLLEAGVDPNLKTDYGETPLSVCLLIGDIASLRLLLDHGTDPAPLAWTPLHRAVALDSLEAVAALARSPSAINGPLDRWGHSPWQLAAKVGSRDILDLLADRGADLAATDRHGESLLHLGAKTNSAAVSWLLEHGASLEAVDDAGRTPLHYAAEYDALDAARDLVAAGIAVTRTNTYSQQALNEATSLPMVRLLLEAGADPNFVDGCGDWALKSAAQANDTERVAFLLAHGAEVDLTSTGETALHAAARADAREVMDQLLAAGANPSARDVDGWTPFFCACSREAIHRLRAAGGDPALPDDAGGLPKDWHEDPLLKAAFEAPLP